MEARWGWTQLEERALGASVYRYGAELWLWWWSLELHWPTRD